MSKFGNIDLKEETYGNLTRVYGEVGKENVFDVKRKKVRKYPTTKLLDTLAEDLVLSTQLMYDGPDPLTDSFTASPFYLSIDGAPFQLIYSDEYSFNTTQGHEFRFCFPQSVYERILRAIEYDSFQWPFIWTAPEEPEEQAKIQDSNWADYSCYGPPEPEDL